jgi:hypothetical protein
MAWYKTTETAGQDRVIACHSHLIGRVWSDQSNQSKRNQQSGPNSGTRSIEGAFNQVKATLQVVLAYLDYFKVFESFTDASSN